MTHISRKQTNELLLSRLQLIGFACLHTIFPLGGIFATPK